MDIYERIQIKAIEKGISIKALEKEVGIGNGVIKKWGSSSPQCNKLLLVANYLHVSLDWLVTGESNDYNLSENEKELLESFAKLPEREQIKFIGRVEEVAKQFECKKKSSNTKID